MEDISLPLVGGKHLGHRFVASRHNRGTCITMQKILSITLFSRILLVSLWVLGTVGLTGAKTVSDQLGRSVDVPDTARRILALAPSVTEIMYALDLQDLLVGATQFSDYPAAAALLPKVGSYVRLDVEKIVSLRPDLCIAVKDGNPLGVIKRLESLGIPVYAVDPNNLISVLETMTELGTLLGVEKRAKRVTGEMSNVVTRVQSQLLGIQHRPGVFFQIGITPIVSAGTSTFIHDLIVMAGGSNLAQGPTLYPRYSKEQVLGLRPEVIIITSMARQTVFAKVKAEWEQWLELPAVINNRIHLVDSDIFDRASPRLVKGLEVLAELIHPESFQESGMAGKP